MSLAHAPLATPLRVTGIDGSDSTSCRLMEMGMIEGVELSILRRAPLGDPLHIRVGDYELSLRSSDADLIDVAPL